VKQEALRERLLLENDLLIVDVTTLARGLSPGQLAWGPDGGWGVGQVLEHLVTIADSYFAVLRPLVYDRRAPIAEIGRNAWDPTLTGRFLVAGMRSRRRMRTPPIWQVGAAVRADVLDAFVGRHRTLEQLLRAAAALDWKRLRLHSPASRFFRLNLGDAFSALVVHGQRHLEQMDRVRRREGFPAA